MNVQKIRSVLEIFMLAKWFHSDGFQLPFVPDKKTTMTRFSYMRVYELRLLMYVFF